jgi:hypothetical protein
VGLGLERAIGAYIAEQRGYGLWDDADRTRRVVFLGYQPPVPPQDSPPADDSYETLSPLAVTVFLDGGIQPTRDLLEPHRVTIQVRHALYETAMGEQRAIHVLLHENGATCRSPSGTGVFPGGVRIARITADFPPQRLGRDPSSRDGRYITTQTFTVRAVPPIPLV